MPLSSVALCSRALMKTGAQPIQSFYDDRAEAEIALAFFEPTRDMLLSSYPWRFARGFMALPRLVAEPLADFAYAHQLPSDCLRILSVGDGGSSTGLVYRRVGNTLHSNAPDMVLSYVFRPDDEAAPAYFEAALMARLAAEFCLPLTENTERANMLYRLADIELDRAKRIDAQQDTPNALTHFNLIDARSL
jgi:hypothetical protein